MKSRWRASFFVVLSVPVAAWAQSSTPPPTSPSPPSSSSTPSASASTPSSSSTFDRLDTNHDGVLSKDEFKAGVSQPTDQQQAGHSGGHHGGGFGAPGGGGGFGGPGGGGGGFGGGSPGGGFGGGGFGGQRPTGGGLGGHYGGHHGGGENRDRTNPDQMFENLDTNHDGMLSREEFAAMAHGGASNNDAGSGNYHTNHPRRSNNGQSQSQTPSAGQSAAQN